MNASEQRIAYGCITRIHHLWFESHNEDEPFGKITALFQVLAIVAPYECCFHVAHLWVAYMDARTDSLWRLARYRMRLFDAALKSLKELADRLPAAVRD